MIETIVSWESWELGWVQCPSISRVAHSHQLETTTKIQLFPNFQTELLTGTHSHSLFMPKTFPSYTNETREWLWSNMEKDSFLCRDFRVWNQLKGSEQRMGWELGSQSWENKRKKGIFKLKIIGFPLSPLIIEFYWLRGVMNGSKSSWLTID